MKNIAIRLTKIAGKNEISHLENYFKKGDENIIIISDEKEKNMEYVKECLEGVRTFTVVSFNEDNKDLMLLREMNKKVYFYYVDCIHNTITLVAVGTFTNIDGSHIGVYIGGKQ